MMLNKKKIKCPKPIRNNNNKAIFQINNKPAIIVSFLDGKSKKKLSYKNCLNVGKQIAKFHQISSRIKLKRKNTLDYNEWVKIFDKTKKIILIIQKN